MINAGFINLRFLNRAKSCTQFQIPRKLVSNICPRRAMLYVPGNDQRKIDKALQLKVDCIAFDCEDGVAQNQKEEARKTIRDVLNQGNVSKNDPEWCVRVNSVDTGDLFLSDIDTILSAKNLPAAIALPKVNSTEHLQYFSEKVWNKLVQRPEDDRGPLNLIMYVESAKSMIILPQICQKAADLATMAPIVPVALVLGYDDLLASIGAMRTTHGIEVLYARQKLVLVAKAFGLQAIDLVHLNFKAMEDLKKECHEGALMGYTGKQVIHPLQIVTVQEEFSPSRSQVRRAKSIVREFKKHQEIGKGAFVFEGSMIDMPSVRQAENVLAAARLSGKYNDDE